jgi:hypothetical protein
MGARYMTFPNTSRPQRFSVWIIFRTTRVTAVQAAPSCSEEPQVDHQVLLVVAREPVWRRHFVRDRCSWVPSDIAHLIDLRQRRPTTIRLDGVYVAGVDTKRASREH